MMATTSFTKKFEIKKVDAKNFVNSLIKIKENYKNNPEYVDFESKFAHTRDEQELIELLKK